ncbi:MAG: T9SS type A sorting domain-containing protein, partial [Flavobacteriales bacterium]
SYELIAGECDAEFTEIFSYVAVDACGNASDTLRYIVHTFDNEAPEFTEVPEDQTLACPGELPSALAVATDFCSDFEVTFVQDTIAGNCPSNYQIVRTFTATDACGNVSESVSVTYTIVDEVAPQFETELSNVSIECFGEIVPVEVEVSDNCSTFDVNAEVIEIETDDCGYGTFEVLYTATDACGNVNTASYIVTVADTQDPTLSGVPADLVLACDAQIPAPAMVSANDNCNGELNVEFTETFVGDLPAEGSIADCRLLTPALAEGNPCNYPYDWAMALFGMPAAHRYYQVAEGNIARYPNGTAHVTATLVNAANANNGFNVDVWFGNEMDWSEWSSQSFPTSFKADCGGEDANYQDWLYFILQNGDGAELTGFGAYAGSAINLVHAPSNNYFGFQLGDGANNYNGADNGFGGWFTYSGSFIVNDIAMGQGGIVTGAGDFAFELDCCPRYEIVRCWTAYDCAGNVVSVCQNISFEGSTITDAIQPNNGNSEEEVAADKGGITLSVFPNPANENATFTFSSALKGRGKLEVFDVTGAKVAELFNNNIIDNTEYRVDLNVSVLSRGIYTYRITNGIDTEVGRLIVTK